jgi:hypothetical protein
MIPTVDWKGRYPTRITTGGNFTTFSRRFSETMEETSSKGYFSQIKGTTFIEKKSTNKTMGGS